MDKIIIEDLNVRYSDGAESLKNINLRIPENAITVLFGPAGGGKSTLLRSINRLNDLADVETMSGRIIMGGENILDPEIDTNDLRRRVGMVFSRPVPLPLSIYQNVSYGLEVAGEKSASSLNQAVEKALRQAVLWEEVYDRLHEPAHRLSGGQQQRLCLARVLALTPEVILMDEPTSALDPISTTKIENLLQSLKQSYTIIIAPHNTQQSARLADYAAFFLQGELIEAGNGEEIFLNPREKQTLEYIQGRFG